MVGVCLDRTSAGDRYIPTFHFHNLLIPSETVALSLSQNLIQDGVVQAVYVDNHDAQYQDFIERFKQLSELLDSKVISVDKLIQSYVNAISNPQKLAIYKYPLGPYLDVLSLAAWFGFDEYKRELFNMICNEVESWPSTEFSLDFTNWEKNIEDLLLDRQCLEITLKQELENHSLDEFHDYGLLPVSDLPVFWE